MNISLDLKDICPAKAWMHKLEGGEVEEPQAVLGGLHQQLAAAAQRAQGQPRHGLAQQLRVPHLAHRAEVLRLRARPRLAPHQDHAGAVRGVEPAGLGLPAQRVHVALVLHQAPERALVPAAAEAGGEHVAVRARGGRVARRRAVEQAAVHEGGRPVLQRHHQVWWL
eukprot:CAMPEP_0194675622 /NCGR_PEP_ID=MMETSP0295-20121207/8379_1 /TAXON_ID=39354 /ORGANISM="Heterosigma akashiwo, Strain CCMP2393" /LENGTH=166 /DNA_ID=CAMNT_0039560015 /DNA_START=149 /DNA_END=647 /DNA_ORIENTATION=-